MLTPESRTVYLKRLIIVLMLVAAGCGSSNNSHSQASPPTATATTAPTVTPSPGTTATASPTLAPTASPTLAPTASPTLAPTASPTATATAAATSTPTASATPTPTPTPGPQQIAFTVLLPSSSATPFTGTTQVWVMNGDGTNPHNVSSNSAMADMFATLSPDGTRIAFDSTPAPVDPNQLANIQMFVMNSDGTGRLQLTSNGALNFFPAAWSADSARILFSGTPLGGKAQIYVVNRDGSGELDLSSASGGGTAAEEATTFSRDASKVFFSSDRQQSGVDQVWAMNSDGTSPLNLSNDSGNSTAGYLSPDGTRIAYASTRSGFSEIWVMNTDGSGQTQVTADANAASHKEGPFFSPDGSRIYFFDFGVAQTLNAQIFSVSASAVMGHSTDLSNDPTHEDIAGPPLVLSNGKVVFNQITGQSSSSLGVSQIRIMNPDGSGQSPLFDQFIAFIGLLG